MRKRLHLGLILAPLCLMVASPLVAQSDSQNFEGQYFTATVKNVARSPKTGRVIITILFRGKEFGNSHNVALGGVADQKACATLIDDAGGTYQAKTCIPYLDQWYGGGGLIIKSSTDTMMAFEFLPDPGAPVIATAEFNLVIPFQLLTCKTIEQSNSEGGNNFGDKDSCAALTYKFSNQSMSFYGLMAKRVNAPTAP